MTVAGATPASLVRSVRVTAIVTAALGPILVAGAAMTHGLLRLLDALRHQPGAVELELPPHVDFLIDFASRSGPVMVGLGIVFLLAGGIAWRRPAYASGVLCRGAELGGIGMVVLAALWWLAVEDHDLGWAMGAVGILGHAVQAALIARAWLFLRRPEVRAALRGAEVSPRGGL